MKNLILASLLLCSFLCFSQEYNQRDLTELSFKQELTGSVIKIDTVEYTINDYSFDFRTGTFCLQFQNGEKREISAKVKVAVQKGKTILPNEKRIRINKNK